MLKHLLIAMTMTTPLAQLQNGDGEAQTVSKTFSRETSVTIFINAAPEQVWAVLTNGNELTRWNSTITFFEGRIAKGEKVTLKSTLDEKRTFKLKVAEFEPNKKMVWKDGAAPFFKGVRTYTLEEKNGGTVFHMTEKLSGMMFPMAAKSIPDFKESFEQYAADLKKECEKKG